jgi:hypothetical protein
MRIQLSRPATTSPTRYDGAASTARQPTRLLRLLFRILSIYRHYGRALALRADELSKTTGKRAIRGALRRSVDTIATTQRPFLRPHPGTDP